MKHLLSIALGLAVVAAASAQVNYSNNFDSETAGTLPAGWYLATPWGTWAPGPLDAQVAAAPGGGQALKLVWGTDWGTYAGGVDGSSGEAGFTYPLGAADPTSETLTVSYRFYSTNDSVWMMFGQQSGGPLGASVHLNDDPNKKGHMDVGNQPSVLTNVPLDTWINVLTVFDAATDAWTTTVAWSGGGGVFNGTATEDIANEFWFGGWVFKSTMDAAGDPYDNMLFIDNFSVEVTPEPSALALLGLGGLGLLRRR